MTNVLTELSIWASKLPYWEQAALDKIVAGISLTDADYDQLLQYLLEDAELAERVGTRPTLQFSSAVAQSQAGPMRLVKISNLQDVNALVPGQTLSFDPTLTAIFGGNGSGKSGYARVLGCAGFTRGDREILPDVTKPACADTIPSADIELSDGISSRVIHYQSGERCPELASFYVFDSTSVIVHLTKENTFSFSPAGLSHLTQLADVTDQVRERLRARIKQYSEPHDFAPLFQGESETSNLIANLGRKTDLTALQRLATLTSMEQQRLLELDSEIAKLKSENIPKQIDDLKQTIADLVHLTERLHDAEYGLSDQAIEGINNAVEFYLDREALAQRASVEQFKSKHFTQIGSGTWRRFIEAAKALADIEQKEGKPYPQTDDYCLLCQQPLLSAEARDLLQRLWAFLEADAQSRLDAARSALEEKHKALVAVQLDFFNDQAVSYRHLKEYDKHLLDKVTAFVEAARRRRADALSAITALSPVLPSALPNAGIPEIENTIKSLKTRCEELEKKNPAQEIAEYQREFVGLQHRVMLGKYLSHIEAYVEKQIWAERAGKVGSSTRHITLKHSELFKQLVTDRYVQLFEQILRDLKRPLKIRVQTKGYKGDTLKQIVLETDPSANVDKATPDKVLSGGEKRAVALADFLTEVTLDEGSSGIILDDPVTSLDFEWKETIAARLLQESKRRQVIVFTHDLHFLYLLKKYAEEHGVESATHWIKRGDHDGKPGHVHLNNCPSLEKDYKTPARAQEFYKRAMEPSVSAEEQERLLRDGFGALRSTYEAFVVFDLLGGVVERFEERISVERLRGVVIDKCIIDQVIEKMKLLSRYIEAHLHSDIFSAQKPTAATLLGEIRAFEELKKKHKELKKA